MKKLLIISSILLVFAVGASAQVPGKPFTIYAGGGITLPNSPDGFKELYKMGFNGMGALAFKIHPMFDLVGKVEYHYFSMDKEKAAAMYAFTGDPSGGSLSTILFGLDARFAPSLPAAPIKPYVFAGLGMAKMSAKEIEVPIIGTIEPYPDKTKMYLNFGAGLDFQNFFIQARYLRIASPSEDDANDDPLVSIPISVGLKF